MRLNPIPAVEIDGPGCSYNPDPAAHEEAVAEAVAAEVRKTLERELTIKDPTLTIEAGPDSNLDELALLQVRFLLLSPFACICTSHLGGLGHTVLSWHVQESVALPLTWLLHWCHSLGTHLELSCH
jgi:hypothetical protein